MTPAGISTDFSFLQYAKAWSAITLIDSGILTEEITSLYVNALAPILVTLYVLPFLSFIAEGILSCDDTPAPPTPITDASILSLFT